MSLLPAKRTGLAKDNSIIVSAAGNMSSPTPPLHLQYVNKLFFNEGVARVARQPFF